MEASIYNIVTENEQGEHIIYNTLKRGLAVLDDNVFASYVEGEGPYAEALAQAGILVESARYEQDIQEKQFDEDRRSSNWFALCIAPTYECNYQCPYCYERGFNPGGTITPDVIEAIFTFFETIYARDHFENFSLSWYGGEPTLCMDILETVTKRFRSICEARNIDFSVGILSNCGTIDKSIAHRLADCGVEHMMPTIDGMEHLHNRRRVTKGTGNAFKLTVQGAHNCREAGIRVGANMNTDRINMKEFKELRDYLHTEHDIDIYPSLMKDYRQDFDRNNTGFDSSAFDLYTREEYAHDLHKLFIETPFTREVMEGMFRPVRDFCRGQLDNYYVIDPLGDAYKCEGWIGQKEHSFFNVLDIPEASTLHLSSYNPLRDEQCRDCKVLPLCKGQCYWDRALLENACHVAKFTMPDYVRDYRSCFGEAKEPLTIFVENTAPESYLEEPFECDGPNESRWAGIPWYEENEEGEATYNKGKFFRKDVREGSRGAIF